jgi:hypothetical protein
VWGQREPADHYEVHVVPAERREQLARAEGPRGFSYRPVFRGSFGAHRGAFSFRAAVAARSVKNSLSCIA